ncbi:MAG TPA: restriction endonuclease, partial [bacterium]|nr:restriction endonuclease [bacterium]
MSSREWKDRLLKIPGALQVKNHLIQQGHAESEAETGALLVSGLVIFLMFLLFNSFILGFIRAFFNNLWTQAFENPTEGIVIGLLSTIVFLGLLFRYMAKASEKKAEQQYQERRDRHKIDEKRQHLRRGAMGNFDEIFRFYLAEKYPEIEVKSCHVVDTTPRVRFIARRFTTEFGGQVDKNYQLFRDTLFSDTLHVLETAFGLSENIPAVIVDGLMQFIDRSAKYYEGAVLSLKAERAVYDHMTKNGAPPFKILTSFDLRYRDGMEVQRMPEEESKTSKVIEKIKEKAPKLDIHYEEKKQKVDEGWEKPKTFEEPAVIQETLKGKELNALSLDQFQALVAGFLAKMNFEVLKAKKIPGGTLQFQVDFRHPVVGGNFTVLARQYPESAPVHADLVRQLDELSREEATKRGIFVVTGRFTEEARNISKKMAVDLVDGPKFNELLEGPPYDGRWTFRVVDEKGVVTDLSKLPLLNFEKEVDLFLKSMGFRVEKIRRVP